MAQEIKYDKSHHAGGTPDARIANRLRNSGGEEADTILQKGSGPTRTYHNIHNPGSARQHEAAILVKAIFAATSAGSSDDQQGRDRQTQAGAGGAEGQGRGARSSSAQAGTRRIEVADEGGARRLPKRNGRAAPSPRTRGPALASRSLRRRRQRPRCASYRGHGSRSDWPSGRNSGDRTPRWPKWPACGQRPRLRHTHPYRSQASTINTRLA